MKVVYGLNLEITANVPTLVGSACAGVPTLVGSACAGVPTLVGSVEAVRIRRRLKPVTNERGRR